MSASTLLILGFGTWHRGRGRGGPEGRSVSSGPSVKEPSVSVPSVRLLCFCLQIETRKKVLPDMTPRQFIYLKFIFNVLVHNYKKDHRIGNTNIR